MSEMTLFSKGGNTLPAHLKNLQLDATTKALMGGSGNGGGKRISIRGNVFRMMVDGKEIAQNEDRAMNIIIAAANANVSRTFYAGTYQEGQAMAPTCWSNDGVTPDIKSEQPQASKCASCAQNIKGSGQGDSRACRFTQRLAVLLENDIRGDIYQLTLPAQSIFGAAENGKMPLQSYAKFLGSHGLPVTAVVTEMRFDTASATPRLTFKAVRPLNEEELAMTQDKGQSAEAKSAIAATAAQLDGATKAEFVRPAAVEAPKAEPKVEAEAVETAEPTKRAKKAAPKDVADILDDWAEE
tara:strand:+ start:2011 stop:2901 length:891 start_codon:yes stop_codon:yes gene_type:complete